MDPDAAIEAFPDEALETLTDEAAADEDGRAEAGVEAWELAALDDRAVDWEEDAETLRMLDAEADETLRTLDAEADALLDRATPEADMDMEPELEAAGENRY